MDVDALQAAGLYDPDAPDAAERLELFEHLFARGATIDLIEERLASGDELFMVATSLTRSWPPVRSVRELAAESGTDVETAARIRLALGFAVDDVDRPTVRSTQAEDIALFTFASEVFGIERVLAFTRVLGASASRLADAANSLFGERVAEEHDRHPTLLELSQANELAQDALQAVPALLGRTIVEHLGHLVRRLPQVIDADVQCVVGFVDLVDSTLWAGRVSTPDHTQALARFETTAWDAAARHGGRIVKMIGDEAMFVTDGPDAAARIAQEVCDAAAADPVLPSARGAIGRGAVTTRDGDYFGPLVNTVARATKLATPDHVVALAPADAHLDDTWELSPPRTVALRGVEEPVRVVQLVRRRPPGT